MRFWSIAVATALSALSLGAAAQPVSWLAKRFAAKEAASKALGTGIAEGIGWHHFIIANDTLGKPCLRLEGPAEARARALGATRYHLSLSDEREYAVAYVVLES